MGKVIGIDLGTTNSTVVVMEGGTPRVIPNREGARTTPSVVGFTKGGERLVGQIAQRRALTHPEDTIYGVKRLLGRRFASTEIQSAVRLCPYKIVEGPNGDAHIQIQGRVYSPPEIEAVILLELKEAAQDYLREPVEDAIISVPAYFNDSQRQATKDAGSIAGLNVLRILNEASAAAIAFGAQNETGRIAVYDLGGGTFDISIVELNDGFYTVLASGGDTLLGGFDFDDLIVMWMIDEFKKNTNIDLDYDPIALLRLKEAAEKSKCDLSTNLQTEVVLPFISGGASEPKHLNLVLTRGKFESMIQPMLDDTLGVSLDVLHEAGLSADDLDQVVAVGGQTRTPAVVDTIRKTFGREPNRAVNPDEIVAIGTAIQTGVLSGEVTDLVFLDVTPHTLGIETSGGTFTPLVERNTTIPTRQARTFTTVTDKQTKVEVHVLQGESTWAYENTSLGQFELSELEPAQAGEQGIDVSFEIDVNGIVQVSAVDLSSGQAQNIVVRAPSGLSQAQIESARTETEARAQLKNELKMRDTLAGELHGLVQSTRNALELVTPTLEAAERDETLAALAEAEQKEGGSAQELQAAISRLESAAEPLGRAVLSVRHGMLHRFARWLQRRIGRWTSV